MTRHVQLTITGKVENIGFRLYALWGASEYHINGEVRQSSGKIIIEAEGKARSLTDFVEWCRTGPEGSVVETVSIIEKAAAGYKDFTIL